MKSTEPIEDGSIRTAIDRDASQLEAAIRLVASGRARAVTVVGLRLATAAIALVTPLAVDLGVAIEPLLSVTDSVTDVRIAPRS